MMMMVVGWTWRWLGKGEMSEGRGWLVARCLKIKV